MKRLSLLLTLAFTMLCLTEMFAQVPNKQGSKRAKPVKKKPVVEAPAPAPEPVREPTLEETKDWIVKKMNQYKPVVSFSTNVDAKNACEWIVEQVSFDENDKLVITMKPDPKSTCIKDLVTGVTIDFTDLDPKKTTAVETGKRIMVVQNLAKNAIVVKTAPGSPLQKMKMSYFSMSISFDKSVTYEPNLTNRLGKAFVKMTDFKKNKTTEKEAF